MKELDEKKGMGPDEVSGRILKECRGELASPIYIIKCSTENGTVPVEWKRAEVEEPLNYRPVSLTIVRSSKESRLKLLVRLAALPTPTTTKPSRHVNFLQVHLFFFT
ncbi:hypothetical protein E2C01_098291 [Portunus trituberculatus]|uniref:Uncharacterized protein n=1 Tax=Portunus trituberculatus TaxID=210409 RepID=A0A5B7KDV0_PORTR|nr:hypothetical protein [Portunus trituberculatus]